MENDMKTYTVTLDDNDAATFLAYLQDMEQDSDCEDFTVKLLDPAMIGRRIDVAQKALEGPGVHYQLSSMFADIMRYIR
jgi:hypothetical protein